MQDSTNCIHANAVKTLSKAEWSNHSVDIRLSLDFMFDFEEEEIKSLSPIAQTINDYIVSDSYISIDNLAIENTLMDYIRRYSLNQEISSIKLILETPVITSGSVSEDLQEIIEHIETKNPKVKVSLQSKAANCCQIQQKKDQNGQARNPMETKNAKIQPAHNDAKTPNKSVITTATPELYLSAAPYDGPVITSSSPKQYISAIPETELSKIQASMLPSMDISSISGKDVVKGLSDTLSTADNALNHETVNRMLPDSVKLGSNNKIYTNSKFQGNKHVKIVTTVSKDSAGAVLKKAGIVGTTVSAGITAKEGLDKIKKAQNNEGKWGAGGEATGKIVGSIAGGAVGADLGAKAGTAILIGAVVVTGATISAPVALTVIGGCAVIFAIGGSMAGEKVFGQAGESIGGAAGAMIDKRVKKNAGSI